MKRKMGAPLLFFFFLSLLFLPQSHAEINVSGKLRIVWEGATFDHNTGITTYSLSLRNISRDVLAGPFEVVIEKTDNSYE
jgi:hypothetical protein